jgi:hypothetical protein
MAKTKQVLKMRVIENEFGQEKVEVMVKGSVEELQSLIFSAMQDDNIITNAVIGAMNAYVYKRMDEDRKARLN